MTEESYQQGRKIMLSANYRRGIITKCKGNVARWTKIEMSHRENLQEGKANGAAKMLTKALIDLEKARNHFAELKFPDSDLGPIKKDVSYCEICGDRIAITEIYCAQCIS